MRRPRFRLVPLLLAATACNAPSAPSGASSPAAAPTPADAHQGEADAPSPDQAPDTAEADATPTEPDADAPASPELVQSVATGFNTFGLDLYRQVASSPGNQIISPASIAIALAMTHAGAAGKTATEMHDTLHYAEPTEQVHRAIATLHADWNAVTEDTELAVANRLYGELSTPWHREFLSTGERVFGAPLDAVDFKGDPDGSRVKINSWVKGQTHDRIVDLLPQGSLDDRTRLVLTNALYFKGRWQYPFAEHGTAAADFHAPSGTKPVPMMSLAEDLPYAAVPADGVELVELPYADGRFAMTVVLPQAQDGLTAVEASLDADRLARWHAALSSRRMEVSMPKVTIEPTESLVLSETLKALGIREAFTRDADFSGMTPNPAGLMISEVYHKGFMAIDEKGTEAAAATAVVMMERGLPPQAQPFVVDHPYLVILRDKTSGLVMFIGRVVDPPAEVTPKAEDGAEKGAEKGE